MGYDNYAPCNFGPVTATYTAAQIGIGIASTTYPAGRKVEGLIPGRLRAEDGKVYKFVKAAELLAAGNSVEYDVADTTLCTVSKTEAVLDLCAGIAETSIASGEYGWITIAGGIDSIATALVDGTTDVVAGDLLSPSTTAGTLKKAASGDRACAQAIEAQATDAAVLKLVRLLNASVPLA